MQFKSQLFSYLNEILTGCSCPKWGLAIYKLGGCAHMVWQKCRYKFCWDWLGHFPWYSHAELTFCTIRKVITFMMTCIGFISFDYKIFLFIPLLEYLQSLALTALSFIFLYFVIPNGLVLAMFLEILLISYSSDSFQPSSHQVRGNIWLLIGHQN